MNDLLNRCGIHLSKRQLLQLWAYHQLLRRHDADLNLTRIRNFDNMVVKLYADSILPALHATLPSPLLDLGTGPGMPGIPLKIFRPDLHILLAESRQQRIDFLKIVVGALDLPGLEVVARGIASDYNQPVAGVITRAVEPIADTLARVQGCLVKDGMVLFMKGPQCDQEIENAASKLSQAFEFAEDIAYRIPHSPHRRRLVGYRRITAPLAARDKETSDAMHIHRIKVIESNSNAIYKDLKKLFSGRGVKKQGQTLVCGTRLATEAMEQRPDKCVAWISSGDRLPPPVTAPVDMAWLQLAPDLFREIDLFGVRHPMVLYETPTLEPWRTDAALLSGCSLLIPFQDPENVGAVIRSAVAFNVDRIVILTESANPFHPKAVRASAGTVFSANLFQGPSLSAIPPRLPVIALAATGHALEQVAFPRSFCLLPGMEGPGLPAGWKADTVSIAMNPAVESLNAAVAAAITLYEWRRRQNAD
jgi:16S rRNA (guanine(527)-N(7))-methyltransferase RsmG